MALSSSCSLMIGPNSLIIGDMSYGCLHCPIHDTEWHCGIILWLFHLNQLGTCSRMHMTEKSIEPRWFISLRSSYITFMHPLILFRRKHNYDSCCSLDCRFPSTASLHLYWVWALLVHPTPKAKVANCVHHIYLFVVFRRHSKMSYLCATFKSSKYHHPFCVTYSSW